MQAVQTGELCLDTDDETPAPVVRPTRRTEVPVTQPAPPPAPRPALPGLPDVELDERVRAARARHKAMADQYAAARAARERLGHELGLEAGTMYSARTEAIATQMLYDGQDADAVDRFEAAAKLERRLAAAVDMAARDIEPALATARRAMQPQIEAMLAPSRRGVALVWLQLVRAHRDHADLAHGVRAAGFGDANLGLFHADYPGEVRRTDIQFLLNDNTLRFEDVADLT